MNALDPLVYRHYPTMSVYRYIKTAYKKERPALAFETLDRQVEVSLPVGHALGLAAGRFCGSFDHRFR